MDVAKLGIKIDYDRDVENPARIFHAMGEIIDGINEVHQAILDSVGLNISLSSKLDRTIEGSLIGVQRQSYRGSVIEKKKGIIDSILARTEKFLGEPKIIDHAGQIHDIVNGYQKDIDDAFEFKHSDELNVTNINAYRVAKGFEKIFNAKETTLSEKDRIYFGSKDNCDSPKTNFPSDSYFAKTADELFISRQPYRHSKYIIGISKAAYAGDVWGFHWLSNCKGRKDFSAKILHRQWLESWFDARIAIYPGDGLEVDIDIYLNTNKKRDKQAEIVNIYRVVPKRDMEQMEIGYDNNDV